MANLSKADFEPLQGAEFTVTQAEGEPVTLRLASVSSMPERSRVDAAGTPVMDGFSLVFTGNPEQPLAQGMYALTHEQVGTHEWFVVPVVSQDAGVRAYEVLFSWLVEQPVAAVPESPV